MENLKNISNLDEKQPELTKEELNARREEISAFYKENIPHLEVQGGVTPESPEGQAFKQAMESAASKID